MPSTLTVRGLRSGLEVEPDKLAELQARFAQLQEQEDKLAAQLVAPGGLFVTCSCSGQLGADAFERIVINSIHRTNRRIQIFDRTGAGGDHPNLSNYPESRYLKLLWGRVV